MQLTESFLYRTGILLVVGTDLFLYLDRHKQIVGFFLYENHTWERSIPMQSTYWSYLFLDDPVHLELQLDHSSHIDEDIAHYRIILALTADIYGEQNVDYKDS